MGSWGQWGSFKLAERDTSRRPNLVPAHDDLLKSWACQQLKAVVVVAFDLKGACNSVAYFGLLLESSILNQIGLDSVRCALFCVLGVAADFFIQLSVLRSVAAGRGNALVVARVSAAVFLSCGRQEEARRLRLYFQFWLVI